MNDTTRKIFTRSLFFAVTFTVCTVIFLISYVVWHKKQFENKVYPHVFVNNIPFVGKSEVDIHTYFAQRNSNFDNKVITISYEDSIATFSGKMLNLSYDTNTISRDALAVGRSGDYWKDTYYHLIGLFKLEEVRLNYKPQFTTTEIQAFLDELDETYSIPAKNALFELEGSRVVAFKPEEPGTKLNTDTALSTIEDQLHNPESPDNVKVLVAREVLQPEITLHEVNNLGIVEKIAQGDSNYTGSSAERAYNVKLAASRFHGVLIPPGDILSYNKTVGDISQSTGFKTAYVIKNGRTVLGDGGGVCQDSTTLFRAALNAGLPIIERKGHAYRVKYYENDRKPGFDATVFGPTVDFKFKNDTGNHILIQTVLNETTRQLTFEFWGKKDGRVVELSDATVYDHRPAPEPLYQDDPTLPRGVTKQVDWAAPGAKSRFTYKVTRAGEVLQDQEFFTTYRPWQAVYLVGVKD